MTNWKARKDTITELFSIRVTKEQGGERSGRERWSPEKGWEKRKLNLPAFFLNSTYYFNHWNIRDSFNWLCSVPVLSILEAMKLEAISSQLKAKKHCFCKRNNQLRWQRVRFLILEFLVIPATLRCALTREDGTTWVTLMAP